MSADNDVIVRYTGKGPAVLAGHYIAQDETRRVTRGALEQARLTHPDDFEEVQEVAHDPTLRALPQGGAQADMSADIAPAAPQFKAGGMDDTGAASPVGVEPWPAAPTVTGSETTGSPNLATHAEPSLDESSAMPPSIAEEPFNADVTVKSEQPAAKRGRAAK